MWESIFQIVAHHLYPCCLPHSSQASAIFLTLPWSSGLTGLAQVYDHADNATDKFAYDLDYLHRMNLWLDIGILALSVRNTLGARWDKRSGKLAGKESAPIPVETAAQSSMTDPGEDTR